MRIEWNKVTWYSKLAAVIIFAATFFLGFYLGRQYERIRAAETSIEKDVQAIQASAGLRPQGSDVINDVVFACPDGKSIHAIFRKSRTVDLELSDGRAMTVPQAISASGARYANADESFVFWNKGDGAFIQENGTTTFSDCAIRPSGR